MTIPAFFRQAFYYNALNAQKNEDFTEGTENKNKVGGTKKHDCRNFQNYKVF